MTSHGQSEPLHRFQAVGRFPVQCPEPAQIIFEVARGHSVELSNPGLQVAVVGIDVLHVPRAVDADAGGQVDGVMLDAQGPGRCRKRATAIGTQHHVGRHERLQGGGQGYRVGRPEPAVRRDAGMIASDQNGNLLVGETVPGGLTGAFACLPRQRTCHLNDSRNIVSSAFAMPTNASGCNACVSKFLNQFFILL